MSNNTKHRSDLPFFSIVIPVYNKGPHINRSIRSVLNQTLQDYELIIVNDASTDSSQEELEKFHDPRMRILQRTSPGPGGYAARNLGIKEARAEWVVFLDADDEWYDGHLDELLQLIQGYPEAGLVSTSWNEIEENKAAMANQFRQSLAESGHLLIDFKEYVKKSVEVDVPFCASSVAIEKNILLSVGGFPEGKTRRGGDVDTWLRVMAHAKKAAWSPRITAIYYRDSVNMVTKTEPFSAKWEKTTIDKLLSSEPNKQIRTYLKKYSNKRIIYRYLNSRLGGMKPSERLLPNIFFYPLSLKQLLIVMVSFLPGSVIILLNSIGLFISHRILKK